MTNSNNQQAVAVKTRVNAGGKETTKTDRVGSGVTTKTRVPGGSAFARGPWRARVSRSLLFALLGTSAAILSATPTVPAGQLGAVQYVTGDFNGDGITDLIVVTASGSYEYLGLSGGGFVPNVWVRTDLTFGKVQYVTGDFNGDGITDLIIVTATGSYEYLGQSNGGFVANVWVRSDLTLGNVQYVTGSFSDDTGPKSDGFDYFITDLIIVTNTGSYEYLGQVGGGFVAGAWFRDDLTMGKVQYVTGDFNGDYITDLIIVTASGSYEYLGQRGGGFVPNVWVRTDLTLGNVQYVTGHFNTDISTDLIIVTANGSSEYFGSSGGFVAGPWVRNDLTLGNVQYVTGNFDGDFVTDLIIVTASGSSEYLNYGPSIGFVAGAWVRNALP